MGNILGGLVVLGAFIAICWWIASVFIQDIVAPVAAVNPDAAIAIVIAVVLGAILFTAASD